MTVAMSQQPFKMQNQGFQPGQLEFSSAVNALLSLNKGFQSYSDVQTTKRTSYNNLEDAKHGKGKEIYFPLAITATAQVFGFIRNEFLSAFDNHANGIDFALYGKHWNIMLRVFEIVQTQVASLCEVLHSDLEVHQKLRMLCVEFLSSNDKQALKKTAILYLLKTSRHVDFTFAQIGIGEILGSVEKSLGVTFAELKRKLTMLKEYNKNIIMKQSPHNEATSENCQNLQNISSSDGETSPRFSILMKAANLDYVDDEKKKNKDKHSRQRLTRKRKPGYGKATCKRRRRG